VLQAGGCQWQHGLCSKVCSTCEFPFVGVITVIVLDATKKQKSLFGLLLLRRSADDVVVAAGGVDDEVVDGVLHETAHGGS
jgi:hypothetical protein